MKKLSNSINSINQVISVLMKALLSLWRDNRLLIKSKCIIIRKIEFSVRMNLIRLEMLALTKLKKIITRVG
jgi:hypothetical protein